MTQLRRRVIFWTFVLSFFIIAPLLIFFAFGYRYSTQKHAILKTGTLIASSVPKGAVVKIDDKMISGTTPLTARAITPGTYTIRFEKENYLPWVKRLPIDANRATFAADIHLFPDAATEAATEPAEALWIAPKGDKALGVWLVNGVRELRLLALDVSPIATTPVAIPNQKITSVSWRDDGLAVLLNNAFGTQYLLDVSSPPLHVQELQKLPLNSKITWSPDGTILLIEPTKVSGFSALGNTKILINSTPPQYITDAARVPGGALYLLLSDGTKTTVRVHNPSASAVITTEISTAAELHFRLATNEYMMLTDSTGLTEVFRIEKNSLVPLAPFTATSGLYNAQSVTYLYSAGNDIWIYSLASNVRELLLRTSTALAAVGFMPDNSNIFYRDTTLHALEMDGRDARNDVVLVSPDFSIQNCSATSSGARLYCVSPTPAGLLLISRPL